MWPKWAAPSKVQLPSTASNWVLQPLESVTEFDVPVPILLCLSSPPHLLLYSILSPLAPLLTPLFHCFLLAAKSSWNFFRNLRLQIFLLLFSLLLLFFALVCLSCRFSSSIPPPTSLRSTACHVSFMFVCLSCDMCHMKYGGYDIRNMSSLNFPQCYCYSSQPRSGFAFPFFSFFFSASSSAPSFSVSFPFVYFALCEFRLCKWIL